MMIGKPTFLFVPGGWHQPSTFDSVTTILSSKGYEYQYIRLATVGRSPPLLTNEEDVQLVRHETQNLLDSGKDVIIVMHSYGGTVGSEAMKYFIDEDTGRFKPHKNGAEVVMMSWIAAFVLPTGVSLMSVLNFKDLPWWDVDGDTVNVKTPHDIFYNDLSEDAAAPHIHALKSHAYRSMYTEISFESYKYIPSAYLLCEDDKAIPLSVQKMMVEGARTQAPKAFDIVESCSASHSPFLSMPDLVATFLLRCAGAGSGNV